LRRESDTDAGRDGHGRAIDHVGFGAGTLKGLRDARRTVWHRSCQEDGELVASEPGAGVRRADAVSSSRRCETQDSVTGLMSKCVIDPFEPIEIEHQHRDRHLVPLGGDDGLLKTIAQQDPIGQARECIVGRRQPESIALDPTKPVTAAHLGETVRVTVTVIAPADRSYVVIEDLLPAGLEPVDARLKTVDPALKLKLDTDRTQAAQRQTGGYAAPWFGWYYSPWQQVDLRDDRAALSAERLPKGVYEYVYYARATAPGDFFVAPAHAEETYFPEVFGRSDSSRFTVLP